MRVLKNLCKIKALFEWFLTNLQRISNIEFDFTDHISIHLCAMSWGYVMSQRYVNGIARSGVQGFYTWTNVMALYSEVFVDSVFACCWRSHCKDLPTKSIFMLMLLGVFVEPHYDMIICSKRTLLAGCMGPTWGHLGPSRPRWAPCWPHELCYLGTYNRHSIAHPWLWINSPPPGATYMHM